MQALTLLRIQARANRLANLRLHTAMAPLPAAELLAPRVGFFPSLLATLNHILAVDLYYIAVLHTEPGARELWTAFVPPETLSVLAERQRVSDERLIDWLLAANEATAPCTCRAHRTSSRPMPPRTCCSTCSRTRPTTAARCTPCCRARWWRRRSSMSS